MAIFHGGSAFFGALRLEERCCEGEVRTGEGGAVPDMVEGVDEAARGQNTHNNNKKKEKNEQTKSANGKTNEIIVGS